MTFDFTGSSPQTPGFVNAPYSATASALLLTFLMLINPDIPHNAGLLRPIRRSSIRKARSSTPAFPAATTFGNSITGPTSDAIFRAFAQALPKMVTRRLEPDARLHRSPAHDPRRNRPYVDILFLALKGGSGATWKADGYDHIGLINCAGGILAQDYEMFEIHDPHRPRSATNTRTDSAGAGRWRGGLGVDDRIRASTATNVTGIVFGDGVEEEARAFGIFGGRPGSLNAIVITDAGRPLAPAALEGDHPRHPPRRRWCMQRAGGGGGYGDPRERPVEDVLADVRNGLVSVARARDDYGVVIDPVSKEVDDMATRQLRENSA